MFEAIKFVLTDAVMGAIFVSLVLVVCGFMVKRVSVRAGFVTLMLIIVSMGVGAVVLTVHAESTFADTINNDCRLMGGCTDDVIQSFCAPSPAACPSVGKGDEQQAPAYGSTSYLAGER